MSDANLLTRVMLYFQSGILSVFHSQSEKYELSTDDFSGDVRIRSNYRGSAGTEARLHVQFGFRLCKSGEWAVAAWGPDLAKASPEERRIWIGFQLQEGDFDPTIDRRFQKWIERYIEGRWDVEDGPIACLDRVIRQVNSIAQCTLGLLLFCETDVRGLCFPLAENNHRYHDAHSEAYKHLQDALNKDALTRLGQRFEIVVKPGDKKTLSILMQLLPENLHENVLGPLDIVSNRRAAADHRERPEPESFPAFDEFNKDIRAVVRGLETLRDWLSEALHVDLSSCEARAAALAYLPPIDDDRESHESRFSICAAANIEGKRVVGVRGGYRKPIAGHADTEALIFELDDGSILGIDPISNIGGLLEEGETLRPEAVHITLWITFVPPLKPFLPSTSPTEAPIAES